MHVTIHETVHVTNLTPGGANPTRSPYLNEDWVKKGWTKLDGGEGFSSDDALFFENRNGKSIRCVNVTDENENTCSDGACPGGCQTMEETSRCTCKTCGLGDKSHCTGGAVQVELCWRP
jgi:hypothetical protein